MAEIRRVNNTDIDSIKVIYERAFDKREGILMYYPGFRDYVEFCIKQNYAYVANEQDVVCGVLLAYEKPDLEWGKVLYIELLAVLPEYQSKGIGTTLLDYVKEEARSKEFKELALRTGCYMPAYEMYKKYGFIDARDDQRYMIKSIRKNAEE